MAYEFNGTSQDFTTSVSPVTGTPLTMACWFNADNVTAWQQLVAVYSSTASNRPYMGLFLRGDLAGDPVQAGAFTGGAFISADTTAGYATGTWSHACAVYTSTSSRTVYLNGGNSATTTTTVSAFTPNALRVAVFINSFGTKQFWFDGRMAEVGIWNIALSATDVASLAAGVSCRLVRPDALVFYAPLIRDLLDARGGIAVTNNNAATVAVHPRIYA